MTAQTEDDTQALRRLSIFGALSDAAIEFLRQRCEHVTVDAGADFFAQGEIGDSVYVLRSGQVSIVRCLEGEGLVLAELEPGHCFGEMALVAITPRNATARALQDCTALRLRNMALLELYQHDLEQFTLMQMNLGREVARRLATANCSMFEYARRLGETGREADLLARAAETLK